MDVINYVIRPQLIRLLEWKIGFKTSYSVSIGKSGKYMNRWLETKQWNTFLQTYPSGTVHEIWKSVFIMCKMFDSIGKEIAHNMKFEYNEIEANNSLRYLKDINVLPKDAKEIY